jgi:hypothetical protein
MPPNLPSSYDVCKGWNMVGFRSVEDMAPEDYLGSFSPSEYGAIYGWDPYLPNYEDDASFEESPLPLAGANNGKT